MYKSEAGRYVKCRDSFVNLLAGALGWMYTITAVSAVRALRRSRRMPRYEKDVAECPNTLIMLGGNDSDFDWPAVAETPEEQHDCNTPIDRFVDCYARVLDKIISLGSRPIALNLIPVFGRRYFNWFSKRSDPEQLMRFLGSTDSIEHWNEMYNLAVMRCGGRAECARARRAQRLPLPARVWRRPLLRGRHTPQRRRPSQDVRVFAAADAARIGIKTALRDVHKSRRVYFCIKALLKPVS